VSSSDQQKLIDYIDGGGSVYIEGADVAFNHHTDPFFSYFGTSFVDTGVAGEILSLTCIDETFTSGLIYDYCGGSDAHHKIDELSATTGTAFLESEDQKVRAVFNLTETYKTICSAPIIGAFGNGTGLNMRAFLMRQYVDFLTGESTSIEENKVVQVTPNLEQNYPNPFNPSTTISFSVEQTTSFVTLEIFNLKGQIVKQLVSEQLPAGQHTIIWNGKDNSNKAVSSGIYIYKMKSGNYTSTKKMLLLK